MHYLEEEPDENILEVQELDQNLNGMEVAAPVDSLDETNRQMRPKALNAAPNYSQSPTMARANFVEDSIEEIDAAENGGNANENLSGIANTLELMNR